MLGTRGLRGHVPEEVSCTGRQAGAPGVDECLPRQRAGERVVARRGGIDDVVEHESHPLFVAVVQFGVADQRVGSAADDKVCLHQPPQQRVVGPRDVGESLVTFGGGARGVA